jgi:hypothetical protein
MAQIKHVEQFAPTGTEADKLLAYPFEAPTHSYFTDGEIVTELPDTFDAFVGQSDVMLAKRGLPQMADRIMTIEYGSNVSPYQAQSKMGKYGNAGQQAELQSTPKIIAKVVGADIVWHGKPGQKGSTFAELYKDESTAEVEAPCFVAFMTEKQLAVMHTTEGVTYEAVWLDVLIGSDEKPAKALAYVAQKSTVLLKDGKPVRVQRPGAVKREGAMTAEEAVDYMLANAGGTIGSENARSLIGRAAELNLEGKKELQAPVQASLREQGRSQPFGFPKAPGSAVGRADFNSIKPRGNHDTLRLMEQVVEDLRPTKEARMQKMAELEAKGIALDSDAGRKALAAFDIARTLHKRATEEYAADHNLEFVDKSQVTVQKGKLVKVAH